MGRTSVNKMSRQNMRALPCLLFVMITIFSPLVQGFQAVKLSSVFTLKNKFKPKPCVSQYQPVSRPTSLNAGYLSLDHRFIPAALIPTTKGGKIIFVAFIILVSIIFKNLLSDEADANSDIALVDWFQGVLKWFGSISKNVVGFVSRLINGDNGVDEKLSNNRRVSIPNSRFGGNYNKIRSDSSDGLKVASPSPVKVSAWKTCKLEKKEILNDRFMFYKFKMTGSGISLPVGKKVFLHKFSTFLLIKYSLQ